MDKGAPLFTLLAEALTLLVPTLRVGSRRRLLRFREADAERPMRDSHAGTWEPSQLTP